MFKEEIATALKTKYQRFGLSNEAIDRIASAREKTVNSEDEVATATADVVTMELIASELQKMRDKEINSKTDLQRAFDTYKEKYPETKSDPDPAPGDGGKPFVPKQTPEEAPEPEWARRIRERFEREDREKAEKEMRDALTARLKMEGCNNNGIIKFVMASFSPIKDESQDDAVKRLKDSYAAAYKETFGEGGIPGYGGQPFLDNKSATDHKNDFLRKQGLLPQQEK